MKNSHINLPYKVFTLICITLLFITQAFSQEKDPFFIRNVKPPRFNKIINGDFTTIANNMVSAFPTNRPYNQPIDFNTNSIDNQEIDRDTYDGSYLGYTTRDASGIVYYKMDNVDIDNNPRTFNSSSANLTPPASGSSCFTVKKAYLYWTASNIAKNFNPYQNGTAYGDNQPDWDFDNVLLMLPGETNYNRSIKADQILFDGRKEHFANDPYTCFADITEHVNKLSSPFGKYQIANVEAKTGITYSHITEGFSKVKTGAAAGWQIVFVYEDANLPKRSISLYDGYSQIKRGDYSEKLTFGGFKTVPRGNVNANILFGALEGDKNIPNSRFEILNTSNTYEPINNGTVRPKSNFFNSSITKGDGLFTDRSPASTNSLGFDAGLFKLNNSGNRLIGNNQSNVDMQLITNGDTYGIYLVGFSIEVYQPELGPIIFNSDVVEGENVNPDQIITNTVTLKNRGNDDAKNVTITHTVEPQVELIEPITGLPTGTTYTYDIISKLLTIRVPDNLVKAKSNNLNISFKTQVRDACYFLADNCTLSFTPKTKTTYTGTNNNDPQSSDSNDDKDSCYNGTGTSRTYYINPSKTIWKTPKGALDSTLECDETGEINNAQNLKPNTNCLALDIKLVKTSGDFVIDTDTGCASKGTYTNTWTYKDACGDTPDEVFTQIITVVDNTPPDLSSCGNSINTELTLECGNANNKTIADNWNAANIAAIKGCIKDNCDINVANNITSDYNYLKITEPSCKDEDKFTQVIYSIKDDCDNEVTLNTKIYYKDTTGPSVELCNTIDAETTVECDGTDLTTRIDDWHSSNLKKLESCIEDACAPTETPTLSSNYNPTNITTSCGKGGSITVEYFATDKCGNESKRITAKFSVEDNKIPNITSCANLDKATECNASATKNEADQWNLDNLTALQSCVKDVCDPNFKLIIKSDYDYENRVPSPKCTNGGSITATYSIEDECGNKATVQGKFSYGDGIPPNLDTCTLENLTLECGKYTQTDVDAWHNSVINTIKTCATDDCEKDFIPNIESDYNFNTINPAECGEDGGVTKVKFIVSDKCDNKTIKTLTIIVKDTTSPDITLCGDKLKDIVLECGEENKTIADQWNLDNINAIKACATDACVAIDSNIVSNYKFGDIKPAECGIEGAKTPITYTIKDICGNSATITVNIIVKDTKGPDLSLCGDKLEDLVLECGENNQTIADQWNTKNLETIKACATDACVKVDNIILSNYKFGDIKPAECGDEGGKTPITYIVKDECGNSKTITVNIIVKDTKGPDLSLCNDQLNDIVVECGEDYKNKLEQWNNDNIAQIQKCATDACVNVDATIASNYKFENITPAECGDEGAKTPVTYIVKDVCGNETTVSVNIILKDTKGPDLSLCNDKLNDIVVECGEEYKNKLEKWNNDNIAQIQKCATDACVNVDATISSNYVFTDITPAECGDEGAKTPVTYTVKDICGNETTISVNIILKDTKGPDLTLCNDKLDDIVIECGDDYKSILEQWNTNNIKEIQKCATDACVKVDATISSNYKFTDIKPAECGDEGAKTPVNYTVKDVCGNESVLTVNIILKDTKGPDLSLCNDKLKDISIECGEDYKNKLEQWNTNNIEEIQKCATDACIDVDANITSNYKFEDIAPAECGDEGAKTPVTYIVKDVCGNETKVSVNIILKDTKGPDLSLCNDKLNDIVLECGEEYKNKLEKWNNDNIAQIQKCATDACVDVDATISSNYVFTDITPAECGDEGAKTPVTYTVKDICGNETTVSVNIILKDTKGPDLTLCNDKLNDIVVECGDDYKSILEQWNTNNIEEIQKCATDACVKVDATISSNYKFTDIKPAECGDEGAKTPVNYTVKDVCGNESVLTVNIILKDTKGPDLSLCNDKLKDISIECGEDYKNKLEQWNTNNIEEIQKCATDACIDVDANITSNYKFEDITPAECGDEGAKTPVTYIVKDVCGNETKVSVNIILKDTKGPDLSLCNDKLNDIVLECGEEYKNKLDQWNQNNISQIEKCATDACVDVDATIASNYKFEDITPAECGEGSKTPINYTVKDICGNESIITVNIVVKDTKGPDLSTCKVLDKNTECNAEATEEDTTKWNSENIDALQNCAKDDCDPSYKTEISSDYDFANFTPSDCGNGGVLIVTYFIKDKCGNTSKIKGVYSSGDSSPPDISSCELEGITLECGKYTQKDVDNWHKSVLSKIESCAIDVCEDNFKPTIKDDYDFTKINPAECGEEGAKTPITFTISDKCDNAVTKILYITVKDTNGPDLTLCNDKLKDIVVECGEDYKSKLDQWNKDNIKEIQTCATDDCLKVDANIASNYKFEDIKPAECGAKGAKTPITYTVKDVCGNETQLAVNIILKDTKGPDLSICSKQLKDIIVECGDDYKDRIEQWNKDNIKQIETCATDACVAIDTNIVSNYKFENIIPVQCGSNGAKTPITYTVKDICGNTTQIAVNIILKDTKGPDLSICSKQLKDIIVECSSDYKDKLEQWNKDNIALIQACATDACVKVDNTILSNYKFGNITPAKCDKQGAKTPITYTVSDICGNKTTVSVNIILKDTQGPDLSLCGTIKDLILECNSNSKMVADQWNTANITAIKACATDACLTVDLNNIGSTYDFDTITPANCSKGSLTPIEYTVRDICGNASKIKVNIIYKDTQPPTIKSGNTNVSVSCIDVPSVPKLEFEDACNSNITVVNYTETPLPEDDTITNYTITRTWEVVDECGNDASYSQIIDVSNKMFKFTANGNHCTDDGIIDLFDTSYGYTKNHSNLDGDWILKSSPNEQTVELVNNTFDPEGFELGEYKFTYISRNGYCSRTTELELILNDECIPLACGLENFTISKAITPNGDNFNEYFEIKGTRECGFRLRLKIFNRWGSVIYISEDYQNDWNGVTNKKSIGNNNGKVPNGTYFYMLDIVNSGIKPVSGPIYIGTK